MTGILEALGRGLVSDLSTIFESQLPAQPEDAPEALGPRLAESPGNEDLAVRLGASLLRCGRLQDAVTTLERVLDHHADSRTGRLLLSLAFQELARPELALRHLQVVRETDPHNPRVRFAIAHLLEFLDRPGDAGREYAEAARLCPQMENAHERCAALALREGHWSRALTAYENLYALGATDTLPVWAAVELRAADPELAIAHFQQALLIEPEPGDGSLDGADVLLRDGRHREAADILADLVAQNPQRAEYRLHLGEAFSKLGHDAQAVEQFEAALRLQPTFLEAVVKLGAQHLRSNRLVQAARMFARAFVLNDRLLGVFAGLAVAQRAAGREEEAAGTLNLAASLEPNSALLYAEMVQLYLKHQCRCSDGLQDEDSTTFMQQCLRRHREALTTSPGRADLHYRIGVLLRRTGNLGEAAIAFRNAAELHPVYPDAWLKLGLVDWRADRKRSAWESIERSQDLDVRDLEAHYQLALLFVQRNRFDLAVEDFEGRLQPAVECGFFRDNLRIALDALGLIDRPETLWSGVCELAEQQALMGRLTSSLAP